MSVPTVSWFMDHRKCNQSESVTERARSLPQWQRDLQLYVHSQNPIMFCCGNITHKGIVQKRYNLYLWPWTTKPVYIWSNSQKDIVWVKIIDFYFMPKIIRILRSCSMKIFCTFSTVNISKLNFWLVICIAKNFIWTTLKAIFSIFRFFGTLRFQFSNSCISGKYCPILTNQTLMESLFQLSDDV